jgi:hypothetical protein
MQSEIQKCGEKLLIELPTELALKLGWGVGDILGINQGGLKIDRTMTAYDHVMQIARKGMDEYREALEILAKS